MRKKRLAAALAALLLLISALTAQARPASVPGSNDPGAWWTRGGSSERQHVMDLGTGPGVVEVWSIETGLSASQPLYVDGMVYHLAGDSLWEVDPSTQATGSVQYRRLASGLNLWHGNLRPSTSSLTYAKIGGKTYLYYGSGGNEICGFSLDDNAGRCRELTGSEPIVSTPLVFQANVNGRPADLVVMGDKGGYLWVVQGLMTHPNEDVRWVRYPVEGGAWVTASATAVGDLEFIWAADGVGSSQGGGLVARFRIEATPTGPRLITNDDDPRLWRTYIKSGIADAFTVDGNYAYFADKHVGLYRLNINTGKYDVINAAPGFANAMVATDESNAYFAIRNHSGSDPSRTVGGKLISVNKSTWAIRQTREIGAPINTAPLVWPGNDLVVIGTTNGQLLGFNRNNLHQAQQIGIFRLPTDDGSNICLSAAWYSLLRPGETPYQAEHAYQQLSGSGTDPILANGGTDTGLMLLGVNAMSGGQPVGRLVGLAMADHYNVRWVSTAAKVLEGHQMPLKIGQPTTFTAELTVDDTGQRTVDIHWLYQGDAGTRVIGVTKGVQLRRGQPTVVSVTYTPRAGDGNGLITGVANSAEVATSQTEQGAFFRNALASDPQYAHVARTLRAYSENPAEIVTAFVDALQEIEVLPNTCYMPQVEYIQGQPLAEALRDNFLRFNVKVETDVDLEVVQVVAPAEAQYLDRSYGVQWLIRNHSTQPVTARVEGTLTLSSGLSRVMYHGGNRAYPPGDTWWSWDRVSILEDGVISTFTIEINPDRSVAETDYTNNKASADTRIPAVQWVTPPRSGGGASTGGEVMILPNDCQRNPDLTSPVPCLNYPHKKAAWYCKSNRWDPDCEGY